jgi:hypothetical protein
MLCISILLFVIFCLDFCSLLLIGHILSSSEDLTKKQNWVLNQTSNCIACTLFLHCKSATALQPHIYLNTCSCNIYFTHPRTIAKANINRLNFYIRSSIFASIFASFGSLLTVFPEVASAPNTPSSTISYAGNLWIWTMPNSFSLSKYWRWNL